MPKATHLTQATYRKLLRLIAALFVENDELRAEIARLKAAKRRA